SCGLKHDVVSLLSSVCDGGEDIIALELRVIAKDFLNWSIRRKQFQHIAHAHARIAYARFAAALAGLDGDTREQIVVHSVIIPAHSFHRSSVMRFAHAARRS